MKKWQKLDDKHILKYIYTYIFAICIKTHTDSSAEMNDFGRSKYQPIRIGKIVKISTSEENESFCKVSHMIPTIIFEELYQALHLSLAEPKNAFPTLTLPHRPK
jgi:hypothetical protein